MQTQNAITMHGPIDRIFELAARVEDWPALLPHYRWVKLIAHNGNRKLVEMAAQRDGFPVKWTSVQELFPEEKRITFQHVKGVTRGMAVEWRLVQRGDEVYVTIDHEWKPRWPVVGGWASRQIGVLFIQNIAGKTLRRIREIVEEEQKAVGSRQQTADRQEIT
jgi:ribosome-associated toxin RatA of RatAB toxin-antitoxin module